LLEIWVHRVNIGMEVLSAFIDSSIDNVLLQTNPDFTSLKQLFNSQWCRKYLDQQLLKSDDVSSYD